MNDSLAEILLRMERRVETLQEQQFEFIHRIFEMEQAVVAHMKATDAPLPHDELLWSVVLGYQKDDDEG